jgi:hypothetical protein
MLDQNGEPVPGVEEATSPEDAVTRALARIAGMPAPDR